MYVVYLLCNRFIIHGREWILRFIVTRQGKRFQWITSADDAHTILLHSSDKGSCIEELIATPAWSPVLSLESVNGPQWHMLHTRFQHLLPRLPPLADLETKCIDIVHRWRDTVLKHHHATTNTATSSSSSSSAAVVVGADTIVRLTLAIFTEWLFCDSQLKWPDEALIGGHSCTITTTTNSSDYDILACASWEWRKEIAIKGVAKKHVKDQAIAVVVKWLQADARFVNYLEDERSSLSDSWALPDWYSLVMQPFVLSPSINVSDIAVTVGDRIAVVKPTTKEAIWSSCIEESMFLAHPFPFLERIVKSRETTDKHLPSNEFPPTHAFIPMDLIFKDRSLLNPRVASSLLFGAGPRQCAGKHYAKTMMTQFFYELMLVATNPLSSHLLFQPRHGHLYSGRHNDSSLSVAETWHALKTAWRIVIG